MKDENTMYNGTLHMNANIQLVMNSFGTLFHDKISP